MSQLIYHTKKFSINTYIFIAQHPTIIAVIFLLIALKVFIFVFSVAQYSEWASLDMQWYPTKQFFGLGEFTHILNPYAAFLQGDKFLANGPNYMPLMYYFMFPFALLEWDSAKAAFALCNLIFFLGSIILFVYHGTNKSFIFIISIFVLFGYCFRQVVGNGQSAIMIGFFITLAYCFRHKPIILSIALAFVCIKHSFGLPLMLGFFLAGYRKEVIGAALLVALSIVAFSLQTHTSPIEVMKLLSQVNAAHYASDTALGGPSDLFSLSQKLFHNPISPISLVIIAIYISFAWIAYDYKLNDSIIISSSIILALFTLPHLGYDHYMLFIALLIAKDAYKSISVPILALLGLTLFLFRGGLLKSAIDSLSQAIMQLLNGGGSTQYKKPTGL